MKRSIISIIFAAAALLCACTQNEEGNGEVKDKALRLFSIVPPAGEVGGAAIISGINFNDQVEVKIGEAKAQIVSCTSNRIHITLPANEPGTYPVTLTKGSETASDIEFTYVEEGTVKMTLVNMVPSAGYPGNEVVIYGQGFGDDKASVKVNFDDKQAEVLSATRNIIHAKVPEHAEGVSYVTVENGKQRAGTLSFTYKHAPVFQLISIAPTQGKAGSTAVITGELFSSVPEENIVTIGGVQAEVLSASSEKLTIKLPENPEGTYSITLKVGDKETTGLSYTYLPKGYIINYYCGNGSSAAPKDGQGTGAGVQRIQDMCFIPGTSTIWMVSRSASTIMTLDTATAEAKILVADATLLNNAWCGSFNSKGVFYAAVKAAGKIASVTKEGVAMTYNITKGGAAYAMGSPMDVVFDKDDVMYIAVRDNANADGAKGCVVKVENGEVKAEWPAKSACCLEMGPDGKLYWGSEVTRTIGCIDPATGTNTVVAGTGTAPTAATFTNGEKGNPKTATIDIVRNIKFAKDGSMFFTEENTATLRRLVPDASGDYTKGTVSTIAGTPCSYTANEAGNYDGLPALSAQLGRYIYGIVLTDDLKVIYISDAGNYRVCKLTLED